MISLFSTDGLSQQTDHKQNNNNIRKPPFREMKIQDNDSMHCIVKLAFDDDDHTWTVSAVIFQGSFSLRERFGLSILFVQTVHYNILASPFLLMLHLIPQVKEESTTTNNNKKRRESSRCKRDRNDRYLLFLVLQQHCPASGFSLPSLVYSLQRNAKLAPGSPSLALLLTFLLHFLIFDDDDDRIKNMHLHKWCYYSVNSSSYFFSLFIFPFLFLPLSLFIIFHPPSVSCLFLYQESCSSSRESYSRGDLQFLGQKRYKSSGNLWFGFILQLCLNLIQALFETFLKLSTPNQQQPTQWRPS